VPGSFHRWLAYLIQEPRGDFLDLGQTHQADHELGALIASRFSEPLNRQMNIRNVPGPLISIAGLLVSCGCGSEQGAGSINMSKAKEVAAQRGIPEKRTANSPTKKDPGRPTGPAPTKALPKTGR
jgi:hypothetical protein